MDVKLQQKALRNLAKTAGDVAESAIIKSAAKVITSLDNETNYDLITEQLDLLDTIAYRVYEQAVSAIERLLKRLNDIDLSYNEISGFPVEHLRKYQNKNTLIVKALEILEHIRYHLPAEILDIFFEYSCHEEESVVKQAEQGIKELASYHLDIFYGDGKDWQGLGWQPQEIVLDKISKLEKTQKQKYFYAIVNACTPILSPTISGTSSNYKTLTWRTGPVPSIKGVKNIRARTIGELKELYILANDTKQKKAVLNALQTATHTPHMGDYGDDVLSMIVTDSVVVQAFMKDLVSAEDDMQVMQKIEHDAYSMLQHKGALDDAIRNVALQIRDLLYANDEYQKFRILIGFESIFHEWEKDGRERDDFEREREFRIAEAYRLAESVNSDSYSEWRNRIVSYANIKSNDLATFPYFGKFLERFGRVSPVLALQLLKEESEQIESFIVAILCGIAETDYKNDVYALIKEWCNEGKFLFSLARFFEYSNELDESIFKMVVDKSLENNDLSALSQIVSTVAAKYSADNKRLIKTYFVPAMETLTRYKNTDWLYGFWFRNVSSDIVSDLDIEDQQKILDNLLWLQTIDYHAEEVLCVIAKQSPEIVIQFFCDRLSKEEKDKGEGKYDAIPFSFYKLSEPLSQHPEEVVEAVLQTYDYENYALFEYYGARLLKNIFPSCALEFQKKLLEIIHEGNKKHILFVMAILNNYDGNPVILNVCREIVLLVSEDDSLINELNIIMWSTGVVSGEYGFVDAYKRKIDEIQPWLHDSDPLVVEYANDYISRLEEKIEYETKRSNEDIALMKYQYGTDED